MKNKKRNIGILCGLLFFYLFFTNPSEKHFLNKVSNDFGQVHGGVSLSPEALIQMGTSSYRSYLIYSKYTYSFGNISVEYLGVGAFTFHTRSHMNHNRNEEQNNQQAT